MSPNSKQTSVAPETASRYQGVKPTDVGAVKEISVNEIPEMVQEMKSYFASEVTYSYEWRVQQLKTFKKMITECEAEMCNGMYQDLHKSPFEGFATEISLLHAEIDTALDNLSSWMEPVKKGNSAMNIPCWATTQRDPLGLVLVMGAWNYPIQLSLAPIIGALAAGNVVILKPGSYAVETSHVLYRIISKYFEPNVIRVVEGNRDITSALLKERFEKICFTGSGFVGRIVARAAAEHLTPCILELGGKSPAIIDSSVDLDHAVRRLVWGTFLNSGQTCVRPDFVAVHESVADAFFAKVKTTVTEFYGQDAQKTEWFGRLINDSAFKRLSGLVEENRSKLVIGGNMDASERYVEPSLFDFGTDWEAFKSSSLMADELFGPLVPCVRYRELDEVIEFVKELPTGKPLALYAFSTDQKFIEAIKTRTTSGGLVINDCLMHLLNHELPFGGVGASGISNYHGKYSFDAFTHEKAVLEKSSLLDQSPLFKPLLQSRFPPYTSTKQNIVRMFGMHIIEKLINIPIPALRALFKLAIAYMLLRIAGFKISRADY